MFQRIKDLLHRINILKPIWDQFRFMIVFIVIRLLFRKKSLPMLYKYLEFKADMISYQEYQGFMMLDAEGYNE